MPDRVDCEDYRGLLQADGYAAYPAYEREHEGVTWVACWAHARRKFYEAREEAPEQADFVLELIGRNGCAPSRKP